MSDALAINARLLIDYSRASITGYKSIGVLRTQVKNKPFYSWLPDELNCDLEEAAALQVARDAHMIERMFNDAGAVHELGALDLVHLFIEAGATVHVMSHETPDALQAIIARAGLPPSVKPHPLIGTDRHWEIVSSILGSELAPEWLAVYDLGLTPSEERGILSALGSCGVLVNVNHSKQTQESEEVLLRVIEKRWLI